MAVQLSLSITVFVMQKFHLTCTRILCILDKFLPKKEQNKTKTNTDNYMQTLNSVKWDDAKNCLTKKAKIPDWSSYFPAVCLRGLNGKHKWGGRGGGYRISALP